MPSYIKFMKNILAKKTKLEDYEIMALIEECSAILQKKLPHKLKDSGRFTIPCFIGNHDLGKALCDVGASINLMPLSVYNKLGLKEAKSVNITLQLANHSLAYPKGIIEDMLVKVDKFIFPVDFIVLDMEKYKEIPIILRRPFLATGHTIINVQKEEMTMRIQDNTATFKVFKEIKLPAEDEDCCNIDVMHLHTKELKDMELLNPHIKKNMLRHRRRRNKKKKKQQFDERIEKNATRETLHRSKIQVFPNKHKKEE